MIPELNSDRIESRQGVCGGVHCVRGTRVPAWLLERCRQLGMDVSEIREDYPFLSESDIRAAWEFAELHRDEIAKQTESNEPVAQCTDLAAAPVVLSLEQAAALDEIRAKKLSGPQGRMELLPEE